MLQTSARSYSFSYVDGRQILSCCLKMCTVSVFLIHPGASVLTGDPMLLRICVSCLHVRATPAYFATPCRQNALISEGRTIVVGTQEGLFARAHALDKPVSGCICMSSVHSARTHYVSVTLRERAERRRCLSYGSATFNRDTHLLFAFCFS